MSIDLQADSRAENPHPAGFNPGSHPRDEWGNGLKIEEY